MVGGPTHDELKDWLHWSRIALTVALWTATLTALLALPQAMFPLPWILAFTLPSLLFLLLSRFERIPGGVRAFLATAALTGGVYLAVDLGGLLAQPAALACTLLPPLVFVTGRRKDSDVTLGLFLSFCILLVSLILGHRGFSVWLCVWFIAAAVALHLETRVHALRGGRLRVHRLITPARRRSGGSRRLLNPMGSALASAAIAAVVFFALGTIPSPGRLRGEDPADLVSEDLRDGSPKQVGLSDAFELGGRPSSPIELKGDRLMRVTSLTANPLPHDLYLRGSYFDLPAWNRWAKLQSSWSRARDDVPLRIRSPLNGEPIDRIQLQQLGSTGGMVLVPCGVTTVYDLRNVNVAREQEVLRALSQTNRITPAYAADFQDLQYEAVDRPFDPGFRTAAQLPSALSDTEIDVLAQGFLAARNVEIDPNTPPAEIAAALIHGLGQRCSYKLAEPTGPYRESLRNFLFGDRTGYCMHFSSAFAIMLRSVGVPCRIGVGLIGGDPDPAGGTTRIFGSQHAHAWVEIPIDGLGWIPFDATPAANRLNLGAQIQAQAAIEDQEFNAKNTEAASDPWLWLSNPWLWLSVALAAVFWFLIRNAPSRVQVEAPPPIPRETRPARRAVVRVLRELQRKGMPSRMGRTLDGFANALAHATAEGRIKLDVQAVGNAFTAYQEIRFGGRPHDADSTARLEAGLEAAKLGRRRGTEAPETISEPGVAVSPES